MSTKRYLGIVLVCIPALLIIASVGIFLGNTKTIDDGWINIVDLPQEFLNNYFEKYSELQESYEPENILLVTSKTRPEAYGAARIVEAPNHLYILQYTSAEIRDAAYDNLEKDGVIVERNQTFKLMGNGEYLSWGIVDMGLDYLTDKIAERGNANEAIVAVVDSGMNVEDFTEYFDAERLLTYCVVECNDGMDDRSEVTHGTHVGGTVAEGTGDNVKILAIKVTNDPEGEMYVSDIIDGIYYAIGTGVDVINMSLGGESAPENLRIALESAKDMGIVNVAAAGNDGVDTPNYPASYDSVISVAAVDESWEDWEWSNWGEYIDFAAPGVEVEGINGEVLSGTSMATPHVSAAVANIKSLNNDIELELMKEILKEKAIDLGADGWDELTGWGIVNFDEAEICNDTSCDDNGVWTSYWEVEDKTNGKASYLVRDSTITITSEQACVPIIIWENNDGDITYTKTSAFGSGDTYSWNIDNYRYDTGNEGYRDGDYIQIYLSGDVTMDGNVNVLDLSRIKRSLLSPNSKNYQPLTEIPRLLGDVNNDQKINVLDLSRVKRSLLLTSSRNYMPLPW